MALVDQNNAAFANLSVNVSVNMLKTNHRLINAFVGILVFLKHALVFGATQHYGEEVNLFKTLHYGEMSG